jgi:hypothetical protein
MGLYRLTATAFIFSWILLLQTPPSYWAQDVQIDLIPGLDEIGSQIETVQVYRESGVDHQMFGIYDTGASVISISVDDQSGFFLDLETPPPIPILQPGGAAAQGIGGDLVGDVSKPGTILADGLHAFTLDLSDIFNMNPLIDTSHAISVPNIQTFVGTASGSASLPSITGTPIHSTGMVSKVDMQGYKLDFGDGLVFGIPDLKFVAPKTTDAVLPGTSFTPTPVRIPLQLLGENNYAHPGNSVTSGPNPVQNSVALNQGTNAISGKTFLFDTGAQMTIISTKVAAALGLDLNAPATTIDVQGAAGNSVSVPGYIIDSLELPRLDQNNAPISDKLKITNVPVFVLDLGVDGLDGILGMNLWNTAEGLLYDPSDPNHAYVDMTFDNDPNRALTQSDLEEELALLSASGFSVFGGAVHTKTTVSLSDFSLPVPEPGAWILLAMGMIGLLPHLLRGNPFRKL